ncbi:MAG TPA: hypothetical protein VLL07_01790 [Pontiella sp.]|nr:hypothetical protein [Pontiella sp.]
MALNITVPWKIHLSGSGGGTSARQNWWSRRRYRGDPAAHPTLMEEQDLDHLGALHDTVIHMKKR